MTSFHTQETSRPRPRPCLDSLNRPALRGGTLLLVEDSRQTSDSIRQMLQGTGGRLRRADSLAAAHRHLSVYTPDAVIVDLGLPDGCGLELLSELRHRGSRVPLLLAISGQPELEAAALDAGADRFLAKPFLSVAEFRGALAPVFLPARLAALRRTDLRPNPSALCDDLYLALDLLSRRSDADQRGYALQFCATMARSLHDRPMLDAVEEARASGSTVALSLTLRQRLKEQPLI